MIRQRNKKSYISMKQLLTVLAVLALTFSGYAQQLEDLTTKQRRTYNRALREAEKTADRQRETWDIVLDPIEVTPLPVVTDVRGADFTNWGTTLLRANLAARMKAECIYPVVVKVYDTGSKYNHADLKNAELPGANYTTDPAIVPDANGHSTHVAGIIGGSGGGLVWPLVESGLVRIKPVQVLAANGSGSFTWVANALNSERAEDQALIASGKRVVCNFSLGGGTAPVAAVETAAKLTTGVGVVLVAAAGNTGGPVQYPALSDYFIAVSAISQNMQIASFSCRGAQVLFAMPGVGINSTYKDNAFASLSGTSMAAPFQTAAVTLAYAKWGPKLGDYQHVQKYLAKVATDLGAQGKDDLYGYGINYLLAILNTDPSNTPPGDNPPPPPPPADVISTVTATFTGPFVMRYRAESANEWAILVSTGITATLTYKGTAEEANAALRDQVARYFRNRGIVLTDAMQYTDAVYWTGQFLEYVARDAGLSLQVSSVTGVAESGAMHTATGFDKAEARGEGAPGVKLIDLNDGLGSIRLPPGEWWKPSQLWQPYYVTAKPGMVLALPDPIQYHIMPDISAKSTNPNITTAEIKPGQADWLNIQKTPVIIPNNN